MTGKDPGVRGGHLQHRVLVWASQKSTSELHAKIATNYLPTSSKKVRGRKTDVSELAALRERHENRGKACAL